MRPSIDSYFLQIAQVVASRSTCLHRKVGCLLVKDGHAISMGYNGAPSGLEHCDTAGCTKPTSGQRHELCRATHSEANAIIQAALHGCSPEGGTLYSTHEPCLMCSKMLINAKIKRVVFMESYNDGGGIWLKAAGIEVIKI
ncbi:MAG TPA: dCMP deaminase family protein [Methanotrichaceae archaeon]|nr:dCMP deaminase family protein [Methanotrichaceae archaeon]